MLLDPRFKDLLLPVGEKRWEARDNLKQKIETVKNEINAMDIDENDNTQTTLTTRQNDGIISILLLNKSLIIIHKYIKNYFSQL